MSEFNRCILGDCRDVMRQLIADGVRVQTIVTSPPYFSLRDYGVAGQIGLESTLQEFIAKMVEVFDVARELLVDDGTLWLQMGDCYRDKQLVGQPWRTAFALQARGWYLRRDICWHKPNAMPETVHDRPATAHEYLFLLSKAPRYFYDAEAIKEPVTGNAHARGSGVNKKIKVPSGWDTQAGAHGHIHREGRTSTPEYRARQNPSFSAAVHDLVKSRNKRSVWTIATESYSEAHFATFPQALVEPCILAGSRPGDIVFDPFMGSGTVAQVAQRLGRRWLGAELNPAYIELQRGRVQQFGLELHSTEQSA